MCPWLALDQLFQTTNPLFQGVALERLAKDIENGGETRGIEGYVVLEFIVTKTGAVRDPFVVEAKPPGIFDRAAISAALKFKYKPKVVNGEPIDVAGVRNRITFELSD